jgi:hypothetical protein
MQLRIFIRLLILVLFGISSCNQQVTETPSDVTPLSRTKNPTATLAPNIIETLPTSTPSYDEEASFQVNCLDVKQGDASNQPSSGVVVFANREVINGRYALGVILLSLEKMEKSEVQIEGEHFLDITSSPDRTLIAYHFINDKEKLDYLEISTGDFNQEKAIAWKQAWDRILGWADNTHIIIREAIVNTTDDKSEKHPNLRILDISTETETVLHPDFPDIYDFPTLPWWGGFSGAVYDPALTQVVYIRWTDSTQSTYGYSLWNIKDYKSSAFQRVVFFPTPKWSPDGSEFITTGLIDLDPRELFSISKDGNIEQLTHLSDHDANMEILDYFWSPDGRQIALLLKQDEYTADIAVLDLNKMVVSDYCIKVKIGGSDFGVIPSAIWSPNSQQLIIQDWYTKDHRRMILIDLSNDFATEIAEDVEPFAWLKDT